MSTDQRLRRELAEYIELVMAGRSLTYIRLDWEDADGSIGDLESGGRSDEDEEDEDA